jgi:hypothetical protein
MTAGTIAGFATLATGHLGTQTCSLCGQRACSPPEIPGKADNMSAGRTGYKPMFLGYGGQCVVYATSAIRWRSR